ncbi:hypothetical protein ZWY2020_024198 [Hordeum vulgare]|nr:hypothetical protein ZWY2020_024198 [Hordeum vulgare]
MHSQGRWCSPPHNRGSTLYHAASHGARPRPRRISVLRCDFPAVEATPALKRAHVRPRTSAPVHGDSFKPTRHLSGLAATSTYASPSGVIARSVLMYGSGCGSWLPAATPCGGGGGGPSTHVARLPLPAHGARLQACVTGPWPA